MNDNPSPTWRKSSFSGSGGECVEVAELPNEDVAVRDSKDPEGPVLRFTRGEMAAWIAGVRSGEFDDLA